jgi:hypothetical protein
MKTVRIALLASLLGAAPTAALAQYYYDDYDYDGKYAFEYEPYSGDREFDLEVAAVNALVGRDVEYFVEDLAYSYGAPRQQVYNLVVERDYPPDYLWTVAATAKAANRPWNEVFPLFEQQRTQAAASSQGQGWGVTAKRLGIRPGSPEFHALKGDLRTQQGRLKNKPRKSGATISAGQAPVVAGPGSGKGQGAGKPKGPKAKGAGKAKGKGKNK